MSALQASPLEQRPSGRWRVGLPVEFTARDSWQKLPGVALDISLGGMFVETSCPAAFGAAVWTGFTLPGHGEPLLVPGTVRWTSSRGMGVQFGLLGARETRAITETVRRAPMRRT
jgi:type IV pilus assembly protein PilZ